VNRGVFGPDRPEYAQMVNSLAGAVEAQGRLEEAETLLADAVDIVEQHFAADHPRVLAYVTNLARVRIRRGRAAEAEPVLQQVLAARQRIYPAGDWRIAQSQSLLGAALMAARRFDDAKRLMVEADRVLRPVPGPEGDERRANAERLAQMSRK